MDLVYFVLVLGFATVAKFQTPASLVDAELDVVTGVTPGICSQPDSFACGKGICVSKSKKCDGVNDCPDGRDERGCNVGIGIKESLFVGYKNHLVQIDCNSKDHPMYTRSTSATNITALAYSATNSKLYINDMASKTIFALDLRRKMEIKLHQYDNRHHITSMAFDYIDNKLYLCESTYKTIIVLNVATRVTKSIRDFDGDTPKTIAIIPDYGIMFVAFEMNSDPNHWVVDRMRMDGTERIHILPRELQGPIMLHYDSDLHRIFWTDGFEDRIQSMNVYGHYRNYIHTEVRYPSGLTSLSNDIFWINKGSREILWMDKKQRHPTNRIPLEIKESEVSTETVFSLVAVKKNWSSKRERKKWQACKDDEFMCTHGKCIPKSWECDDDVDCHDKSDEHAKCEKFKCNIVDNFLCNNKRCIAKNHICNQVNDCGDLSDERFCTESGCLPLEYHCSKTNKCIPVMSVCNGTEECPDGDDESLDCMCLATEMACMDYRCIPRQYRCDGADDCMDGTASDENNDDCIPRPHALAQTQKLADCKYGFKCRKTGYCIQLHQLCDGRKDCQLGDDEGGVCSTACSLPPHSKCKHICQRTPSGPRCLCRKGYKLDDDAESCTDIDECEQNVCSQVCKNKMGSFECSCFDEFRLRQDMRTCKSLGRPATFAFAVENEVRTLSLGANNQRELSEEAYDVITSMDVDAAKRTLYYTVKEQGAIYRIAKFDEETLKTFYNLRHVIRGLNEPRHIANDWSSDNVYIVEGELKNQYISVCSLHSKVCRNITNLPSGQIARAMVLDPSSMFSKDNRYERHGLLFVAMTLWLPGAQPECRINMMDMSGRSTKTLLHGKNCDVTGLALDIHRDLFYYTNKVSGAIWRMSYDGNKTEELYRDLPMPHNLQLFEDSLYLLGSHGVMIICKLGGDRCERKRMLSPTSHVFVISQKSRQPIIGSMCRYYEKSLCPVCVPAPAGAVCLCTNSRRVMMEDNKELCTVKVQFRERVYNMIARPVTLPTCIVGGVFIKALIIGILLFFKGSVMCKFLCTFRCRRKRRPRIVRNNEEEYEEDAL